MLVFGRFELQPERRRLLQDGNPVAIGARALDVLLALTERRDRVVTKTELLDLVWPGLVVEENNLQVQISALRKSLGPGVISTIPGRGYQFVAVAGQGSRHAHNLPAEHDSFVERGAELRALTARLEAGTRTDDAREQAGNVRHNLPPERDAFVGRAADLSAVAARFDNGARLLTVLGPAG
ncbi:MAG: transcriptional regulator, partial [Candidatus Nanopelagicales bacterium]